MSHSRARMSLRILIALAVCGIFAASARPGWAAEAFKMGVVDPQAVLENSKAGRKALDALKDYAASRQKLLAKDEEELKGLEGQMKSQEGGLSEAQKREK